MPQPIRLAFLGGERTIVKRDAMLVRVRADNGLAGYGPGPAHERAAREIREILAPQLMGQDPLKDLPIPRCDANGMKTFRALQLAVLDLRARYEGCPLSDLMGTRCRDRIELYGSAGMYQSPEGYAQEARQIAGLGFHAYKMRPALGPEQDADTLGRMRAAVGPQVELMLDAHSWWRMGEASYTPEMVMETALAMAAHRPCWLEEPLPPQDHEAYRKLRTQLPFPLATGEHEKTDEGLLDLFNGPATDVVQMDLCCQGGVPTATKLFEACAKKGLTFAFHCWGTDLEVLASAHLGVCWPEKVVRWLEYPCYANDGKPGMYPFALAQEILSEPLCINEGYLHLPDRPGLGVRINEAVLEKYPYLPGPWSFFRIDQPPQTVAVTGDHSKEWTDALPER